MAMYAAAVKVRLAVLECEVGVLEAAAGGSQYDLVDLSDVRLAALSDLDLGQSVFAHSVIRIKQEADRPQDAVAGWNSAM